MPKNDSGRTAAPFILSAALVALDQITKLAVARNILPGQIAYSAFGDFFWLVHHKNLGAAFSMGDWLPGWLRAVVLIALPLAMLAGLVVYYFKTDEFTTFQRWCVGAIVGGGLGNLIDRAFRPDGVIDFLSFKFYGLFGLERWPTFNVADMSLVVGGVLVVLSSFVAARPRAGS